MFERTVSVEEMRRLKAQREESDRLYNEALTALDAAQLHLSDLPQPPPSLDEYQITPLNQSWQILDGGAPAASGWRGRISGFVWRMVGPFFERQQAFNARLVDHLNRNVSVDRATREAIASTLATLGDRLGELAQFQSHLIVFAQQITPYVDSKDYESAGLARRVNEDAREILDIIDHRTVDLGNAIQGLGAMISGVSDELLKRWESMVAREQRYDAKVAAIGAAHEELRSTIAILQQASLTLKREFERLRALPASAAAQPGAVSSTVASAPPGAAAASAPQTNGATTSPGASTSRASSASSVIASSIDSYKYVGFEDRYRGSQEDIRARLTVYLPLFDGASDVLDIGCGRGEFLDLLRERGILARGLDVNHEMVEVCKARGLDVAEGDALGYLHSLPDGSLGGLLAAQVVEHLEPGYLMQMLDVAYHKLRPGSRIILETINPACWFAFFSSYIRDITHVRPLHPDTLSYLLTASGFQRVNVRYEAPYPAHEKLQPIAADGPLAEIFNANVEKLNGLMFTYLDYAAIGERR
jgi:SAM-dependent methyltransferase